MLKCNSMLGFLTGDSPLPINIWSRTKIVKTKTIVSLYLAVHQCIYFFILMKYRHFNTLNTRTKWSYWDSHQCCMFRYQFRLNDHSLCHQNRELDCYIVAILTLFHHHMYWNTLTIHPSHSILRSLQIHIITIDYTKNNISDVECQ